MYYRKNLRLAPAIPDWTKLSHLSAQDRSEAWEDDLFERIPQATVDKGLIVARVFAEDCASRLSTQLNLPVQASRLYVAKLDPATFKRRYASEFLVQVELEYPGVGSMVCLWSYSLAQAVINRATGGAGCAQVENEDFTDIEKLIFQSVVQHTLHSHSAAWQGVLSASPQKVALSAPRSAESVGLPEKDDLIECSVELMFGGQSTGYLRWFYPGAIYRQLMEQFLTVPRSKRRRVRLSPVAVSMVDVPVKAQLGKAIISMADIMQLQRGDIIVLDKLIDDPVQVAIGSNNAFIAQAGVFKDRLAVQLLTTTQRTSTPAASTDGEAEDTVEAPVSARSQRATTPEELEEDIEEEVEDDLGTSDASDAEGTDAAEGEDDILANIEDVEDDEEDEDFVWDESESTDEDF